MASSNNIHLDLHLLSQYQYCQVFVNDTSTFVGYLMLKPSL